MNPISGIKTSSRAGRFKKKLVGPEVLTVEAPLIERRMAPVLQLFQEQKLTAAEVTAAYTIQVLAHRFPGSWLGSKIKVEHDHALHFKLSELNFDFQPNILRRLSGIETLGDLFQSFTLRSTPLSINRSLLHWSSGVYPLILMFCIPSSRQVLEQQKNGRRCVTILTEASRTQNYILGERDALSFTLHDLIHADHFYQHPEIYEGQVGFYRLMDKSLKLGHFQSLFSNEEFSKEFDYLISDMNAYAVHLMKCLKAALLHYGQGEFENWLETMTFDGETKVALQDLNTTRYQAELQDQVILKSLQLA